NGDSLSEWDDKSGNGNNAKLAHGTTPTRVDNQVNGKTIVRFGGNGDMLSALNTALSSKNEMTVLAVMKNNFAGSSADGRAISGMTSSATSDTTGSTAIIPLLRYGSNNGFSNLYSGSAATYRTDYSCAATCNNTAYIYTS